MKNSCAFQGVRGFTFFELTLSITLMLILGALAIPSFRYSRTMRGIQAAAYKLQSKMQRSQLRAIALDAKTGLCIGADTIRPFEYNPFHPNDASKVMFYNPNSLSQEFGVPLQIRLKPSSSSTIYTRYLNQFASPCRGGESLILFLPFLESGSNWQGIITLASGSTAWSFEVLGGLNFQNGV